MKNRFEIRKLGECLDSLESGGRPQGGGTTSGDVPSIGGEHLNDSGSFDFESMKFIPRDYYERMSKGRIKTNDILIVKDGATTGKVSFVNGGFPFEDAAVNEHVFIVRTKSDVLHPHYAFFFLHSDYGKELILKDFRGSAQGGITRGFTDRIQIPLPPLPIQKQIAGILEKADAAREKRKQANQLTEQFLQSAFLEMFGDPVTNPKDFSIQEMENVCNKVTDGEHLTPKLKPSGKYIIMTRDVREDRIDFSQNHFVSEEEFTKFTRRCNPQKGDVLLVSRGATIGRCTVVRVSTPFCLMGSVILIKPRDVASQYLEHLFKNSKFVKHVINLSPASAQQAIYLQNLKKLLIPVPPMVLQQKFAALVEKVESLRAKQRESEKDLEILFQSLMQKAFNGELIQ